MLSAFILTLLLVPVLATLEQWEEGLEPGCGFPCGLLTTDGASVDLQLLI